MPNAAVSPGKVPGEPAAFFAIACRISRAPNVLHGNASELRLWAGDPHSNSQEVKNAEIFRSQRGDAGHENPADRVGAAMGSRAGGVAGERESFDPRA